MIARVKRRLWATVGALFLAYVVLLFAGSAFQDSLMLGDHADKARDALISSSLSKNLAGGYMQVLGSLAFLVGALLLARLLRGREEIDDWLTACIGSAAVVSTALTFATGYAAGAAALYDGHHGAPLATVTTVNDIRTVGFGLSAAVNGVLVLAASAAMLRTPLMPRWLGYAGCAVGLVGIAAVPAMRTGVANVATMLWFTWVAVLAIVAIRMPRSAIATGPMHQPVRT